MHDIVNYLVRDTEKVEFRCIEYFGKISENIVNMLSKK